MDKLNACLSHADIPHRSPSKKAKTPASSKRALQHTSTRRCSCSSDSLTSAKKEVTDQGGKITHEFKLIKGFT